VNAEWVTTLAPGAPVQDPKNNPKERERFLNALRSLAFSTDFDVDYDETALAFLHVLSTLIACEGWDVERWAEELRRKVILARLYDHAEQIRQTTGAADA